MEKLRVLGAEYLLQYVQDAYIQEQKEYSYRVYVTDSLKMIAEHTAVPAAVFSEGNMGQYLSVRWADAVDPPKTETRTAEEIIAETRQAFKKAASPA